LNLTDQYLKALTVLVRHSPNDKTLTDEWVKISLVNAKRFANHLQKGKKHKRDPNMAAHDAVAKVWENLFVKGYQIKKSATTVLYYQVWHSVGDRTMKDDEISYDAILEDREKDEEGGTGELMQGMQEDNPGRFVLRGPQGDTRPGTSSRIGAPRCQLPRESRGSIQKWGMASPIARDTQLTLDL
jgi:hypothetical protein